jgi:hypothetical protein
MRETNTSGPSNTSVGFRALHKLTGSTEVKRRIKIKKKVDFIYTMCIGKFFKLNEVNQIICEK